MNFVTLIPGDGIGPEIAASVQLIFGAAKAPIAWDIVNLSEEGAGVLPTGFHSSFQKCGIALKGPTTTPIGSGHRSLNVQMRQACGLYASVRPVRTIPGVRGPVTTPVDLLIVRENTEDLYAGLEYMVSEGVAHGIKLITAEASLRIGQHAFSVAKKLKRRKVTAVHKANIMKLTDGLFLDCIRRVAKEFPEIEYSEIIVDNCCMQLVTKPDQFDVIVTENLYGDILSDLAAGLVGGLGIAAGANIGARGAIFEAVHGSAPDIAGKDLANPTALLLSGVMMLEHLGEFLTAERIRRAIFQTLAEESTRTRDLGGPLGTIGFSKAVITNLQDLV